MLSSFVWLIIIRWFLVFITTRFLGRFSWDFSIRVFCSVLWFIRLDVCFSFNVVSENGYLVYFCLIILILKGRILFIIVEKICWETYWFFFWGLVFKSVGLYIKVVCFVSGFIGGFSFWGGLFVFVFRCVRIVVVCFF